MFDARRFFFCLKLIRENYKLIISPNLFVSIHRSIRTSGKRMNIQSMVDKPERWLIHHNFLGSSHLLLVARTNRFSLERLFWTHRTARCFNFESPDSHTWVLITSLPPFVFYSKHWWNGRNSIPTTYDPYEFQFLWRKTKRYCTVRWAV